MDKGEVHQPFLSPVHKGANAWIMTLTETDKQGCYLLLKKKKKVTNETIVEKGRFMLIFALREKFYKSINVFSQ